MARPNMPPFGDAPLDSPFANILEEVRQFFKPISIVFFSEYGLSGTGVRRRMFRATWRGVLQSASDGQKLLNTTFPTTFLFKEGMASEQDVCYLQAWMLVVRVTVCCVCLILMRVHHVQLFVPTYPL